MIFSRSPTAKLFDKKTANKIEFVVEHFLNKQVNSALKPSTFDSSRFDS